MVRIVSAGLILSLALFVPSSVIAQKGKGTPTSTRGTDAEYAYLNKMKEVVGKITFTSPTSNSLTFAVETSHYEANPQANKGNTNNNNGGRPSAFRGGRNTQVQQRYNNNNRRPGNNNNNRGGFRGGAGNSAAMQQARMMQQLQQAQIQAYMKAIQQAQQNVAKGLAPNGMKIVTESKEFDIPLSEKVITRRMTLPADYDDKGNLKTYSKEEMAKLKGSENRPGYAARIDDLQPGAQVKLFLTPGRAEAGGVAKPTVTMVLILAEPASGLGAAAPGKKK